VPAGRGLPAVAAPIQQNDDEGRRVTLEQLACGVGTARPRQ
jgi:hypothetical protein